MNKGGWNNMIIIPSSFRPTCLLPLPPQFCFRKMKTDARRKEGEEHFFLFLREQGVEDIGR